MRVYVPEAQRRQVKRRAMFEVIDRYKKQRIFPERLAEAAPRAAFLFRPSMMEELERAGCLQRARLIYSLWEGYLAQERLQPFHAWLGRHDIPLIQIHTSGHASVGDLQRLAQAIQPRVLVPVHSDKPERFTELFDRVALKADGSWWTCKALDKPKSILEGTQRLIDEALRVKSAGRRPPYYANKDACLNCSSKPQHFDARELVRELYDRIEANWHLGRRNGPPSQENWRLERCDRIANRNTSSEVQLERRIARLHAEAWPANQVPVASGLLGTHEDKRCAIDLVYRCQEHADRACYALIELKTNSNTPLFAAFEILLYGLLYIFSRCHAQELGYDKPERPLLCADSIHLCVLAGNQFYEGTTLKWLEHDLSDAIGWFAPTKVNELTVDFSFRASPWTLTDKDWLRPLEEAGRPYG